MFKKIGLCIVALLTTILFGILSVAADSFPVPFDSVIDIALYILISIAFISFAVGCRAIVRPSKFDFNDVFELLDGTLFALWRQRIAVAYVSAVVLFLAGLTWLITHIFKIDVKLAAGIVGTIAVFTWIWILR